MTRVSRTLSKSEAEAFGRELDALRETGKGSKKIGTTKRGIGPTYCDKAARTGIRVHELINKERFAAKLKERIKENNLVLKANGVKPLSYKKVLADKL